MNQTEGTSTNPETQTTTATPEQAQPEPTPESSKPEPIREVAISMNEARGLVANILRSKNLEKERIINPVHTRDLKDILKTKMMKQKALNFINPAKEPDLFKKLTKELEEAKAQANALVNHMAEITVEVMQEDGKIVTTKRFSAEEIKLLRDIIEDPDLGLMDSSKRRFWKGMQRDQIDKTATDELSSNTPDVKLADFLGGNNQGSFYFDGKQEAPELGIDPLTGEPRLKDNILVHYINGYAARDTFEAMNMENALRPDMRCDFLFFRHPDMKSKGIMCLFLKRAALEAGNEAWVLSEGKRHKIYGRHARIAGRGDMAVMDRIVQNTFNKLDPRSRAFYMEALKTRMPPEKQKEAKLFLAQKKAYEEWRSKNPEREPTEEELKKIGEDARAGAEAIDLFHEKDPENFIITSEMFQSVEIDRSLDNRTGLCQLLLTEIQNAESPSDELAGQYRRIRGVDENGYELKNRIIMGGDSARSAADTGRDGHWAYREDVERISLEDHLKRIETQLREDQEVLRRGTIQAADEFKKENPTPAQKAEAAEEAATGAGET